MRTKLFAVVLATFASLVVAQTRPTQIRSSTSQPTTGPSTRPTSQPAKAIAKNTPESRLECARHVKTLGAMASFAVMSRRDGQLSPDLKTLLRDDGMTFGPEIWLCPDSTKTPPADWGGMDMDTQIAWVVSNTEYEYLGGGAKPDSAAADQILVFIEKKPSHLGGYHAVYLSGRFGFITQNVVAGAKAKSDAAKRR